MIPMIRTDTAAASPSKIFRNSSKNPANRANLPASHVIHATNRAVRAANHANLSTSRANLSTSRANLSASRANLVTNGGTDGSKCGKNAGKRLPAAGNGQKRTVGGGRRAAEHGNPFRRILKGFQHPAQGCAAGVTLGKKHNDFIYPERVAGSNPFRVGKNGVNDDPG